MDKDTEFWAMVADADFEHHIVREVQRGFVVWHCVCSCSAIFVGRRAQAQDDQALHAASLFAGSLVG